MGRSEPLPPALLRFPRKGAGVAVRSTQYCLHPRLGSHRPSAGWNLPLFGCAAHSKPRLPLVASRAHVTVSGWVDRPDVIPGTK